MYRFIVLRQSFGDITKELNFTSSSHAPEVIKRAYKVFVNYSKSQDILLSTYTQVRLSRFGFTGVDGFRRLSGMHFEFPDSRLKPNTEGTSANHYRLDDRVLREVNEELSLHGLPPVTYVLSKNELAERMMHNIPFRDIKLDSNGLYKYYG